MPRLGKSIPEKFNMALDEQQKLLNSGEYIDTEVIRVLHDDQYYEHFF